MKTRARARECVCRSASGRKSRAYLNERDLRAERGVHVGEFEADVPGADDRNPFGHPREIERFVRGEDGLAVGFDARRHERQRTRREDDVLRLDGLGARFERLRRNELARSFNHVDAEVFQRAFESATDLRHELRRVRRDAGAVVRDLAVDLDAESAEVLLI